MCLSYSFNVTLGTSVLLWPHLGWRPLPSWAAQLSSSSPFLVCMERPLLRCWGGSSGPWIFLLLLPPPASLGCTLRERPGEGVSGPRVGRFPIEMEWRVLGSVVFRFHWEGVGLPSVNPFLEFWEIFFVFLVCLFFLYMFSSFPLELFWGNTGPPVQASNFTFSPFLSVFSGWSAQLPFFWVLH